MIDLEHLKNYRQGLEMQRAEINGAIQLLDQLILEEEAAQSASSESVDDAPQESNNQGQ